MVPGLDLEYLPGRPKMVSYGNQLCGELPKWAYMPTRISGRLGTSVCSKQEQTAPSIHEGKHVQLSCHLRQPGDRVTIQGRRFNELQCSVHQGSRIISSPTIHVMRLESRCLAMSSSHKDQPQTMMHVALLRCVKYPDIPEPSCLVSSASLPHFFHTSSTRHAWHHMGIASSRIVRVSETHTM